MLASIHGRLRPIVPVAFAIAVAACNVSAAVPAPKPSSSFSPAIVAQLNAAIAAWFTKYDAPGVIVGIFIPREGTYSSAQGTANPATHAPTELVDHVRIGSVTKTFTVTVLLQVVQKGDVGLDDPVSKYVSYVLNGNSCY